MTAEPIQVDFTFTNYETPQVWQPSGGEIEAAWELLVDIATRVPACRLESHEGSDREALASVHVLFAEARNRLRAGGPGLASVSPPGTISFAGIVALTLNKVLRPFLATWHPSLRDVEGKRPADFGPIEWEAEWEGHDHFRASLATVGVAVREVGDVLAAACDAEEFFRRAIE